MSNVFALRGRAERSEGRFLLRWARPAILLFSSASVLVLLGLFVAKPLMTIRHVVVESDVPLSDEQVLAFSGIHGNEHWYSLATATLEKRLEANPLIRRAKVGKIFPDTLRMMVWGRQPAASVLAVSGGRSLPVLVDAEGIVFKIGTTSADLDLPVISGLAAGDMTLGAQLPRAYVPLCADLWSLREKFPSLYALVSEVAIVPSRAARGSDAGLNARSTDADLNARSTDAEAGAVADSASPRDYDLLLYLTSSPVPVRARGVVDETLVKYTLMALDLLSKQGVLKDIQELDFRGGDIVYKMRGAPTQERRGG